MPKNDRDDDDYDDRPARRSDRDDRDDDYDDAPISNSRRVKEFAGKKVIAGILGILLGGLGIHKFVLGFPVAGAIMLVTFLLSFGTGLFCLFPLVGTFALSMIGLIEGIIYLTKSDEAFYRDYAVRKKSWF